MKNAKFKSEIADRMVITAIFTFIGCLGSIVFPMPAWGVAWFLWVIYCWWRPVLFLGWMAYHGYRPRN